MSKAVPLRPTAPTRLHSAVVEIIVKRNAPLPLHHDPELVEQRLQPGDQRAMAYGDSLMEWIDGNLGSKLTMKYQPST